MAAKFNFSDMQGCLPWLAWLALGSLGAAPTWLDRTIAFRANVVQSHGFDSVEAAWAFQPPVLIVLDRGPRQRAVWEPLYLWRTHQLHTYPVSSMKRHSMDVLSLHSAQSRIE